MSAGDLPSRLFDVSSLKLGENRIPCPRCERGPKDTALAVRLDREGSVVWKCHRCQWTGPAGGHGKKAPPLRKQPRQVPNATPSLSAYGRSLWDATMPISGAAAAYLEARACRLPPDDGHLRWLPCLSHPCGYKGPALVALVTDTLTGTPISLHRTWICANGNKAPVDVPRLLLKDHPVVGGVIRLWPDDSVGAGLGIAEGIETALSLAHGFTPVWSCIDAGHLAKFPIMPGIGELVIAADNDEAGRNAADACARRWVSHATGRVVVPDARGADLNDEVKAWAR